MPIKTPLMNDSPVEGGTVTDTPLGGIPFGGGTSPPVGMASGVGAINPGKNGAMDRLAKT
jgi:hypothetical protein